MGEAQMGDDDRQDGLSMIEDESDAVPSADLHHPILGMKSPIKGPSAQGSIATSAAASCCMLIIDHCCSGRAAALHIHAAPCLNKWPSLHKPVE